MVFFVDVFENRGLFWNRVSFVWMVYELIIDEIYVVGVLECGKIYVFCCE